MRSFDVIVAGAGGMGTAAAAHLARRGARVLALDRFPPGHARGSSHGQTRLIRLAYFEHPDYVPLLRRARELWRALEHDSGTPLLTECGLLSSGPADGDVIAGTLRSARKHGLTVERMPAHEAMRRWPAFAIPEEWDSVFEAEAGHLAVEACVRAHAVHAARSRKAAGGRVVARLPRSVRRAVFIIHSYPSLPSENASSRETHSPYCSRACSRVSFPRLIQSPSAPRLEAMSPCVSGSPVARSMASYIALARPCLR
jgi:sarcosine oxidase